MALPREFWLDRLLPPRCLHCRAPARGDWFPWLCASCADAIVPWCSRVPTILDLEVLAALRYEGPAGTLLRAYKFEGFTSMAPRLAREFTPLVVRRRPDVAVAVPLHWRRRWLRGHDQAIGLSRGLHQDLPRLPSVAALRRRRATAPQVGQGGNRRRRNLRGAFEVRRRARAQIAQARVALIDDVVTTGATLRAAAAALLEAGAREVVGMAVAVSPRSLPT